MESLKNDTFVTPDSPSILPSITKYSLLYLAEHELHLKVQERDVYVEHLSEFKKPERVEQPPLSRQLEAYSQWKKNSFLR